MVDDSNYLTTYEAALSVVATAMKKARMRLDTLIINSIMGGILFTAGGMLDLLVQAENPQIFDTNPGMVRVLQGAVYPIGLFYVVLMGTDLYNSNVMFFSVGVARGAVSILDLIISWSVSWTFNFIGNIFVCYVFCNYSHITQTENYITGAVEIANEKVAYSFGETVLKGIACNFFVALAIYLQLMAKPLHVKFLMLFMPVFTFVSMGFTHTVADMYLVTMGLINGAPISVGKYLWKIIIPGTIGNAIGGSFFGLVFPWYLHLVTVERDQKRLKLPEYDARDEQPNLGSDSRVIRVYRDENEKNDQNDAQEEDSEQTYEVGEELSPIDSRVSGYTSATRATRQSHKIRSPENVFPVLGMGAPLKNERSIARGTQKSSNENEDSAIPPQIETMGAQLKRVMTGTNKRRDTAGNDVDIEMGSVGIGRMRSNTSHYSFGDRRRNPISVPQNAVIRSNSKRSMTSIDSSEVFASSPDESIAGGMT